MNYQIKVEPKVIIYEDFSYIEIVTKCDCKNTIILRAMNNGKTCPHIKCKCGTIFKHSKIEDNDILEVFKPSYIDPNQTELWL